MVLLPALAPKVVNSTFRTSTPRRADDASILLGLRAGTLQQTRREVSLFTTYKLCAGTSRRTKMIELVRPIESRPSLCSAGEHSQPAEHRSGRPRHEQFRLPPSPGGESLRSFFPRSSLCCRCGRTAETGRYLFLHC